MPGPESYGGGTSGEHEQSAYDGRSGEPPAERVGVGGAQKFKCLGRGWPGLRGFREQLQRNGNQRAPGLLEGRTVQNPFRGVEWRVTTERMPSCGHFEEDQARREDVAGGCSGMAQTLLGRHVAQCSGGAGASLRDSGGGVDDETRQSEIEHFDIAVGANRDVLGLDIAMNDAVGMRRGETFEQLDGVEVRICGRDWLTKNFAQRSSFHKLHHQDGPAIRFQHLVDRYDVGMIQRGGGLCLREQIVRSGLRQSGRGRQELHGNGTA